MSKIDLRKELSYLYSASATKPALVEVPELQFAMVDGRIEPGGAPDRSEAFREALEALFGISYTLKFMSKLRPENPVDYSVMALEGLWWTDAGDFSFAKPDEWQWTVMMLQPEHVTATMFEEARQQVQKKRGGRTIQQLRLGRFAEGLCVQMMHVGPYADEPRTTDKMMAFAREGGYRLRGKHHEIYLGDPRRAKPERLKTVLRHGVEKET